jgi:hypothetical protein
LKFKARKLESIEKGGETLVNKNFLLLLHIFEKKIFFGFKKVLLSKQDRLYACTVRTVDFETLVCKLYLLFISADAAQEKKRRNCCCPMAFQSLQPIQYRASKL